jgi:hypothetical protein
LRTHLSLRIKLKYLWCSCRTFPALKTCGLFAAFQHGLFGVLKR